MRRRRGMVRMIEEIVDSIAFGSAIVSILALVFAFSMWNHGKISNGDLSYVVCISLLFILGAVFTLFTDNRYLSRR